jgi:hypothetical protein
MKKALFVILSLGLLSACSNTSLRKENERLRNELARQQQYAPLQRDTIHDSVEVITQKVVEIQMVKEVLTDADRQLLRDVGIGVKQLESLQKTSLSTSDTVQLTNSPVPSSPVPSVAISSQPNSQHPPSSEGQEDPDSILRYSDAWADFEYWSRQRKLIYSVRDSLAIAVRREYKHRFLFFHWGLKGYEVKVVNFNPHSTIRHNTFIKKKKK